ncbi:MAG: HAD family hydrolase [Planctomycetia bacterium]|nr:HAD family hydrolase [Planctomycetia bacterium]
MSTVDGTAAGASSGPLDLAIPAGVRAVVFDVVGTLVEPHPSVAVAYQRAAARHGIEEGVAAIERSFRRAWRRQESIDARAATPHATDRERERERWRAIVADVFAGRPETEMIFADLWDHFGRPTAWRPTHQGLALVRHALGAGLTVALASNFDERLHEIARHVEPLVLVPHVFASSELGWRKPAPEFFRCVEERLGCGPAELLLVGDDPDLDLAAGRRAGWHVRNA